MKFVMTPDCIMEGEPGGPETCPVALLLKKHVAQGQRVSVGRHGIYIGPHEYEMPPDLGKWIMQFDMRHEARDSFPLIEFELPIV